MVEGGSYVPYPPAPGAHPAAIPSQEGPSRPAPTSVTRDGENWALGTAETVRWITDGTRPGTAIDTAIPAVFEAYATIVLPENADEQRAHDDAIMATLQAHARCDRWWLGYLDTGADDVVFPEAPRVNLYSQWPYVLVLTGPEQAATWRHWDEGSFWFGRLPNLMFPEDRRWLISTLWDDDWSCVGGSKALVDDILRHPTLRRRARSVDPGADATPPGHPVR